MEVPPVVQLMGMMLHNYDPLLAENLMWLKKSNKSHEHKKDNADWNSVMKTLDNWDNTGTPLTLKSEKYTGHGIVLRADYGKPSELSIHLNQIDRGPNYRWGWASEGASGSLYFYAGNKIFSAHERENTGDHEANDAEGFTNFAVMKNGAYQSIGYNVLESPLYDLGDMQFTEITPQRYPKQHLARI